MPSVAMMKALTLPVMLMVSLSPVLKRVSAVAQFSDASIPRGACVVIDILLLDETWPGNRNLMAHVIREPERRFKHYPPPDSRCSRFQRPSRSFSMAAMSAFARCANRFWDAKCSSMGLKRRGDLLIR